MVVAELISVSPSCRIRSEREATLGPVTGVLRAPDGRAASGLVCGPEGAEWYCPSEARINRLEFGCSELWQLLYAVGTWFTASVCIPYTSRDLRLRRCFMVAAESNAWNPVGLSWSGIFRCECVQRPRDASFRARWLRVECVAWSAGSFGSSSAVESEDGSQSSSERVLQYAYLHHLRLAQTLPLRAVHGSDGGVRGRRGTE